MHNKNYILDKHFHLCIKLYFIFWSIFFLNVITSSVLSFSQGMCFKKLLKPKHIGGFPVEFR